MADAIIDELADAIAAELNNQSFSKPFAAECSDQPKVSLKELTKPRVFVMTRGDDAEMVARDRSEHTLTVDIAVYIPVNPDNLDAEMRPAKFFVEELKDWIRGKIFANCGYKDHTNDPLYDMPTLNEFRLFFSVVTVTFLTLRKLA